MSDHATRASELHNIKAQELVGALVRPVVAAGGSPQDILVLLESVVVGVVVFIAGSTTGGLTTDAIVELLLPAVRTRANEVTASLRTEGMA